MRRSTEPEAHQSRLRESGPLSSGPIGGRKLSTWTVLRGVPGFGRGCTAHEARSVAVACLLMLPGSA
jgi:hypothetical protein